MSRHPSPTHPPPPKSERWVANFILRGFWDEVGRRGIAWSELERQSGVKPPRDGDFASSVHEDDSHALFEAAMALTGDPHLGLSVGRAIGPTAFHLIGHLALACATLPEALEATERAYPQARFRFPSLVALRDGRMRFGIANGARRPRPGLRCEAELAAVLMHDLVLGFLDAAGGAPSVELPFEPPADLAPYQRVFTGPLCFAREGTFISFPSKALVARRSGTDVTLVQHFLRLAKEQYGSANDAQAAWTARVRLQLRAHAAPRLLDVERIAAALDLSSRGLSRRLAREGTSFTMLVDAELYERARALLRRPGTTAAQVSEALGYAELASFFRAFRRWSGGLTPSAYRQRAREA
ncbi:MAG: AraC family transcriptional regulator ligand-binding domain-containing protein [Polyangiales bacterium]